MRFINLHEIKTIYSRNNDEHILILCAYAFAFRIFDSVDGQEAIKTKDDLMVLIEQMENDVLAQWSIDVTGTIHESTSKNLLIKTEKGLVATNFDNSVSIKITEHLNLANVIRIWLFCHEAM